MNRDSAAGMARRMVVVAATSLVVTLAAAGCGSNGPKTSSTSSGGGLSIRSSLDGRPTLPVRVHWVAIPSRGANVSEIDFLIDGRMGWVEHKAPYYYGDDGNWLVASFLTPGSHVFTVRLKTVEGKTATDTVKASVSGPTEPPSELHGVWSRTVTPSDVAKATSGQAPPPGRWKLRIRPSGWQLKDPTPGSTWGLFDVAYLGHGSVQMRPTIEYPPYPNNNNGGFCGDTDPITNWTYALSRGGKALDLRPAHQDPCGDRVGILNGTWRRTR